MNDTPLTTETVSVVTVASAITQRGVEGAVQDGAAGATGVATATLCSQMDSAQTAETASLGTYTASAVGGDLGMNGGVAEAADAASATVIVIDPNTRQQN